MNEQLDLILGSIRELEDKLEVELEKGRTLFGVKLKDNVAEFEREVIEKHRGLRIGLVPFFKEAGVLYYLSWPVIYSLLVPLALMDIWITVFQHICFRIYGMPRVVRSDYVIIDRHHLAYLNFIEAMNCLFCGYANGIIAYARKVASRTEQYWCPIKHVLRIRDPHERYVRFLEYGDAEGYRARLEEYRKNVQRL